MIVDIFIPCFIDQLYPQTAFNMVKVLEQAGCEVRYNPDQTCCGQFAYNSGYWDDAKKLGEKLIKEFSTSTCIVMPSASCVGMVKNYYPDLFTNTILHNEYKQMQKNLFELTDFLVTVLNVRDLGAKFEGKVCYHDSCAAMRECGIKEQPRVLLSNVRGLSLIEMEHTEECCGFGGVFSIKAEPVSIAMAEQKIENALKTGAEYITSTEASCLMHLDSYIKKNNLPLKTIHIVDILASGI
ncbi:MAG: (Fe-S)-binding protein [Bacteroidota bacterium]